MGLIKKLMTPEYPLEKYFHPHFTIHINGLMEQISICPNLNYKEGHKKQYSSPINDTNLNASTQLCGPLYVQYYNRE